jgi:hypothetical protein
VTSTDGISWAEDPDLGSQNDLHRITSGQGQFVAVGGREVASFDLPLGRFQESTILTSADGTKWIKCQSPTTNVLYGLTYADNEFVAVGGQYRDFWAGGDLINGTILTSPDGVVWTLRVSAAPGGLRTVAYGNGQFVAGGDHGTVLTSSDGISWIPRASTLAQAPQTWADITYGNALFVALGSFGNDPSGDILISPDGVNWTVHQSGTTNGLARIAFGNGQFVAAGSLCDAGVCRGLIVTSTDGTNWVRRDIGQHRALYVISFSDRRFVAAGDSGTILISSDGINWAAHKYPQQYSLTGVAYGNGHFVTAGWRGAILQSDSISTLTLMDDGGTKQLAFTLDGAKGTSYTIQISSDLVSWRTLTNVIATGLPSTLSISPLARGAFFRAYEP